MRRVRWRERRRRQWTCGNRVRARLDTAGARCLTQRVKRAGVWIVVAVGLVVAAAWAGREPLARFCLRRLTGLTVEVQSASLGWNRGRFEVRQFVCTNYSAAGARITADFPVVWGEYEPLSLLRRELHVYEIACEIRQLAVLQSRPLGRQRNGTGESAGRSVRVDVVHLKLDGTLAFDEQTITGKMEATIRDFQDFEAMRGMLFRSP